MYENRGFGGQRRGGFSPVKVGDELDVKIEAVGEKGDGIAKEKGFVLFVPGTKTGDEVRIRVTKVLRNVGFAEVTGKPAASAEPEIKEESEETSKEREDASYNQADDSQDTENFGEDLEEEEK